MRIAPMRSVPVRIGNKTISRVLWASQILPSIGTGTAVFALGPGSTSKAKNPSRLGSFELTSFGVLMALAFLAAGWILSKELKRKGEDPEIAWDVVWYGAVGGILGAKIYYLILNWSETAANPGAAILSRAGLVWYGGFILGALLIWWRLASRRLPVLRFGDAIAPALALGYVIGRLGCWRRGIGRRWHFRCRSGRNMSNFAGEVGELLVNPHRRSGRRLDAEEPVGKSTEYLHRCALVEQCLHGVLVIVE